VSEHLTKLEKILSEIPPDSTRETRIIGALLHHLEDHRPHVHAPSRPVDDLFLRKGIVTCRTCVGAAWPCDDYVNTAADLKISIEDETAHIYEVVIAQYKGMLAVLLKKEEEAREEYVKRIRTLRVAEQGASGGDHTSNRDYVGKGPVTLTNGPSGPMWTNGITSTNTNSLRLIGDRESTYDYGVTIPMSDSAMVDYYSRLADTEHERIRDKMQPPPSTKTPEAPKDVKQNVVMHIDVTEAPDRSTVQRLIDYANRNRRRQ